MSLQSLLLDRFQSWQPEAPEVVERTKYSVTLSWNAGPFAFVEDKMLYRLEKKEKIPPWVVVYSGGKTTSTIDNLPPSHPHKFRLKMLLTAAGIQTLADRALQAYGDEAAVYEAMSVLDQNVQNLVHDCSSTAHNKRWVESQWSEETWTSTDTDGTSAVCFCMAVRCGYIKQVQQMLEERAGLINVMSPTNGITPLATAVRKGDLNTVKFLVSAGAEVDQRCTSGQTALQLAVLSGHIAIAEVLLEKGADWQVRDKNDLRVEHYAVDSCKLGVVKFVLDRGGDVTVRDSNGWTPLFRAVCQGAKTEIIEELVVRGSELVVTDRAGLSLVSAAKLLKNRQGCRRDSVLRLVDSQYPHEKALAIFTRLTKKISSVHSLLK